MKTLAIALAAVVACSGATERIEKMTGRSTTVIYDGGNLGDLKAQRYVKVVVEQERITLKQGKKVESLKVTSITELSSGTEVRRRVAEAVGIGIVSFGLGALMLFSKEKTGFIGVTMEEDGRKIGFVLRCNDHAYRGLLTSMEAVSGKKAVSTLAMPSK